MRAELVVAENRLGCKEAPPGLPEGEESKRKKEIIKNINSAILTQVSPLGGWKDLWLN